MTDALQALDLPAWVASAPDRQRHFREAVHIILNAIGTSTALRSTMIMKGGMLMAIRYDSTRFTKDADFSTQAHFAKGDDEAMLKELDQQITLANERLPYWGIRCPMRSGTTWSNSLRIHAHPAISPWTLLHCATRRSKRWRKKVMPIYSRPSKVSCRHSTRPTRWCKTSLKPCLGQILR